MTPATLSLSLTRGITFGPIQFLFSSKTLGVISVDVGADYIAQNNHGRVAGDQVRFQNAAVLPIPLSAAKTYYVLAEGLTTDFFKISETLDGPVIDLVTEGTGVTIALEPADLTGWTVFAEVRTEPEGALVLDLQPDITNPQIGEVTIPAIQDEQTILLPPGAGGKLKGKWDLIFQVPTGERIGPYIAGSFIIKSIITEPA